jgi:hypothetical protein
VAFKLEIRLVSHYRRTESLIESLLSPTYSKAAQEPLAFLIAVQVALYRYYFYVHENGKGREAPVEQAATAAANRTFPNTAQKPHKVNRSGLFLETR